VGYFLNLSSTPLPPANVEAGKSKANNKVGTVTASHGVAKHFMVGGWAFSVFFLIAASTKTGRAQSEGASMFPIRMIVRLPNLPQEPIPKFAEPGREPSTKTHHPTSGTVARARRVVGLHLQNSSKMIQRPCFRLASDNGIKSKIGRCLASSKEVSSTRVTGYMPTRHIVDSGEASFGCVIFGRPPRERSFRF
jgi:hypothetical protein